MRMQVNKFARMQMQSPAGCAATSWRFQPDGYLREVLTARVYDVAVSIHGLERLYTLPGHMHMQSM